MPDTNNYSKFHIKHKNTLLKCIKATYNTNIKICNCFIKEYEDMFGELPESLFNDLIKTQKKEVSKVEKVESPLEKTKKYNTSFKIRSSSHEIDTTFSYSGVSSYRYYSNTVSSFTEIHPIERNKKMPNMFGNEPTTSHQRRLLAAVSPDGKLYFVRYEDEESSFLKKFRNLTYDYSAYRYRIRKCPPHIAEKLIAFDKTEDAEINGYKAWDYITEAGLRIRKL